MRVSSCEVLTAIRAGHSSVSNLQALFRGATRDELLSRLHYLSRTGQIVSIGNHRRRNTDRRWRVTDDSIARQRGRTRCHRLELPVWQALHATRRQTITEVNAAVPGCWIAIRRALRSLEAQGAARRDAAPRVRRTWVRGDSKPLCLSTSAPLGTRRTLLAYLHDHPCALSSSLRRQWSLATIQGAIRAGDVRTTPAGIQLRLWLPNATPSQARRKAERINCWLAQVGAGCVSALPLIRSHEESDWLIDLQRKGWLEGDAAMLRGYGLTEYHAQPLPALEALRSYVHRHGSQTIATLGAERPLLVCRLLHQGAMPAAVEAGLLLPN